MGCLSQMSVVPNWQFVIVSIFVFPAVFAIVIDR
jgi:hypothetical protein